MIEKGVSKKEPELEDLGNFQLIQIAKEAKIRRFTVRKHSLGRIEGCGWTTFCECLGGIALFRLSGHMGGGAS